MGFFKSIGNAIKKVTKQISIKNAIKVGSMIAPGPIGGILANFQANHEAEKAQKAYDAEQSRLQAEYDAQNGGINGGVNGSLVKNPNVGQILIGAASGALTGAGGVLAQGQTGGQVIANSADSAMSEWFKKHMTHIFIGVGVLFAVIFGYKMLNRAPRRSYGRR